MSIRFALFVSGLFVLVLRRAFNISSLVKGTLLKLSQNCMQKDLYLASLRV